MLQTLYPTQPGLVDLFEQTNEVVAPFGSQWTLLPWIGSGGCSARPDVALVFINPTSRNQSAREGWVGERAPFIGLSRIWKVLASAGLIPQRLVDSLPRDGLWSRASASDFYRVLADERIYVTNLVKSCGTDATLPSLRMARAFRDMMLSELSIVQPKLVIGLGGMVSSVLTATPVSLEQEYTAFCRNRQTHTRSIAELSQPLMPCYFPVGRGNPRRAKEMLAAVSSSVAQKGASISSNGVNSEMIQ